MPNPSSVLSVTCVLCGRTAGRLVGSTFHQAPATPLPRQSSAGPHCGACGGSLRLEPPEGAQGGPDAQEPGQQASACGQPDSRFDSR